MYAFALTASRLLRTTLRQQRPTDCHRQLCCCLLPGASDFSLPAYYCECCVLLLLLRVAANTVPHGLGVSVNKSSYFTGKLSAVCAMSGSCLKMFASFTAIALRCNCRPFVEHQVSAAERSSVPPCFEFCCAFECQRQVGVALNLWFTASLCFECRMTLYRGDHSSSEFWVC